jgi:hypothetical protein
MYIDLVARSGEQLIEAIRLAQDRSVKMSASLADALRWPTVSARDSAIAMEICFDFAEQLLESQRGYVQRVREVIQTSQPDDVGEADEAGEAGDGWEAEVFVAPLLVLNGGTSGHVASAHN